MLEGRIGPAPLMKTSGLYGWEKLPGAPRTPGMPGRWTLMTPMLTEVALVLPSEFWFVFWLTFPEVPIAACPLLFPVFPTALITVVGLSANAGQAISIRMVMVAADSHILRITDSPHGKGPTVDDPGGERHAHRQS